MANTISGPWTIAPTGSTGNNSFTVNVPPSNGYCIVITTEAVGATPTATFGVTGSQGPDSTGVSTFNTFSVIPSNTTADTTPVTTVTSTTVGSQILFTLPGMFAKTLTVVVSANTNVTYRITGWCLLN